MNSKKFHEHLELGNQTPNSVPVAQDSQAQSENSRLANKSEHVGQLQAFSSIANNSPYAQKLTQFNRIANGPNALNTNPNFTKNETGLPDKLKSGIESLGGFNMDDVRVHYNSSKPAQLQAHAYAQGTEIHIAPGQEKHLPHEAWHVVQQKQGRVKPTLQMKGIAINDDSYLEKEADIMGAKALGNTEMGTIQMKGISSSEQAPIQMAKARIKGSQQYDQKGELKIDFEERRRGDSVGMYGTIKFIPGGRRLPIVDKIELVQIASMTTNNAAMAGDSASSSSSSAAAPASASATDDDSKHDRLEEDHEVETEGDPVVKNMWRYAGKYHMDLLGDRSVPRSKVDDPIIEQAYNSERRDGQLDGNKHDRVYLDKTETIRDEYNFDLKSKQIDQQPGYIKADGTKGTELFDFPVSPDPVIATFHTSVIADGRPWATVKWGFKSEKKPDEEYLIVSHVNGPTFSEGQTNEMENARLQFDRIMANPGWTSPEYFNGIMEDLKIPLKRKSALKDLRYMADVLGDTIDRINKACTKPKDLKQLALFGTPHIELASEVLAKLSEIEGQTPLVKALEELINTTITRIGNAK